MTSTISHAASRFDPPTDEFLPFRSFTTTIQFDRGTGFIERAQREGGVDSPYFAEMSARGVY